MLKRIMSRRPTPALIVSLLALVLAMGGFAIAAIPDRSSVFHGCYKKKKGNLRLVSSSKKCKKSERATSWNQKGQNGAKGANGANGAKGNTGDTGARGPSDAYAVFHDAAVTVGSPSTIASINLPAGKFVITAKAWLETNTGQGPVLMSCSLTAGGDTDNDRFRLEEGFATPRQADTMAIPLEVVHEFSLPGTADFTCDSFGVGVIAANIKIIATKVENLTNTGV